MNATLKFKTMKNSITLVVACGCILLSLACIYSCNTAQAENLTSAQADDSIPDMLTRDHILGSPDEYDMLMDRYDLAIEELNSNPNDAKAMLSLVEIYMTEARITGAFDYYLNAAFDVLDLLDDMGDLDPEVEFRKLAYGASMELTKHQFQKAKDLGEEAVKINPHNSFGYGILVDANVELGYYDQAVQMADKMVSIRPDLRSYSRVSYLREIHGDMDGAIEAMNMAVQAGYPGFEETSWAKVHLATLCAKSGRSEEAKAIYAQTLEERTNFAPAHAGMAEVLLHEGQWESATQHIEKAMNLRNDPHYHVIYASLLLATGEQEEYELHISKSIDLLSQMGEEDSDHGHSHAVGLEMGWIQLEHLGDVDEALHNAKHEFADRPDNIEVNELLATAYYLKQRLERAKRHLDKANTTKKNSPNLICLDGLIAFDEGDHKYGKKQLEKALGSAQSRNSLLMGLAQEKLKDYDRLY